MTLRWNLRIFALLVTVALQALAAKAAQTYDAIYVFGDSYCDVGNLFIADKGEKPAPPYYKGHFSNGPIWVEHLAAAFKLPMEPALAGGTNYAFGGAELLANVVTPAGTIPSVPAQIETYLAAHDGKADPAALYIIEGGGNDILNATSGSATQLGFEIGATLASLEVELRQAGAEHFLVPGLFDVGLLPAGRANGTFDEAAVVEANEELAQLLALESHFDGIHVYNPDIAALARSIQIDPAHFGFTDVIHPCLDPATGKVCADQAHTLFWDEDHPTTFGHAFLTVAIEAFVHP